jgi:hypothetical protein
MYAMRFLCVLFCLSLSACIIHISDSGDGDWSWGHSPVLQGSGVRGTQQRTAGEFRRVRASTLGDVHVVVGSAARVEVSCDDNLLEHVRTRVVDGELVIDTDGESMAFRQSLRVEVGCAALEGATLSGSGSLALEGLAGERFEASLSGSGELSARGKVARASLSLTGSGDLVCRELVTEEAQVSLSGSGDVRVHATQSLSVSVSGSGDVRYSGAPARLTRSVAGSGTIAPE